MADQQVIATGGLGAGARAFALGGFGPSPDLYIEDPTDRRVAVQGVGEFGPRNFALQGFDVRLRRIHAPAPKRAPPRRRNRDDDALLFMLIR